MKIKKILLSFGIIFSGLTLASCNANNAVIKTDTTLKPVTNNTNASSKSNSSANQGDKTPSNSTNNNTPSKSNSSVNQGSNTPSNSTNGTPVTSSKNTVISSESTETISNTATINIYNTIDSKLICSFEADKGGNINTLLSSIDLAPYEKILDKYYLNYELTQVLPNRKTLSEDIDIYSNFKEMKVDNISNIMNYNINSSELTGLEYINSYDNDIKANNSQAGFVEGKFEDFSQYENTNAYVKVSTADELISALALARNDYDSEVLEYDLSGEKIVRKNVRKNETNWVSAITKGLYLKNSDGTYTKIPSDTPFSDTSYTEDLTYYEDSTYSQITIKQNLKSAGSIHVIEILNDIDLGYKKLSNESKASGIAVSYTSEYDKDIEADTMEFPMSSMFNEHGISQIKISKTNNLLIYSKNGAKLTHGGFSVESSDRIAFRNLSMDELWQWEDSISENPTKKIGDMDVMKWSYLKISFYGYIWIDHCTFGKAYDGIIDISNPYYYSSGTAFRAPYGKPSKLDYDDFGGVHISNCEFLSGDTSKDGYVYKMMQEIEADYQKSLLEPSYKCKYLYYKNLRDLWGLSFDDIFYGIAIPHKKAFLWGDSGDYYGYNLNLKVSMNNCYIKNIEDRLPNVRGGIAYIYNTVFDNREYREYYKKLRNVTIEYGGVTYVGVQQINKINGQYKCGMVSQAIVGGFSAGIRCENCIYLGVVELIKNNNLDSDAAKEKLATGEVTAETLKGGVSLINVYSVLDDVAAVYNTDIDSYGSESSDISSLKFNWHNLENVKPFTPVIYFMDGLLQKIYDLKIGVNNNIGSAYLIVNYE